MKIVVTGGLGFIGSSFVKMASARMAHVVVIDKNTYAADRKRLDGWVYDYVNKDICDDVEFACKDADYIVNFAAESHVDNSISNGLPFIRSYVEGTFNMLEIARIIPTLKKFIQISTDEVYGDIEEGISSTVWDNLIPSSYYSATKASADHLVMAAGRTYGLPYLITRTCNNFGAHQHKEKFLPKIFDSIKNNKDIPVYGDGEQVREWIWVEDNVRAIWDAMLNDEGIIHIGSRDRWTNKEIIQKVGELLGDTVLYKFVEDRLGHDRRYALVSTNEITFTLGEFLKEYARENLDS